MDKLERLYALHDLFGQHRAAIPLSALMERLECSPATAKRAIRELRTLLAAPLVYDVAGGSYRYEVDDGAGHTELPGLWFRAEELAALVTLREMLTRLEPGLLNAALAPLARRLDELLARRRLGLVEAARRVRIISQHARAPRSAAPSKHYTSPRQSFEGHRKRAVERQAAAVDLQIFELWVQLDHPEPAISAAMASLSGVMTACLPRSGQVQSSGMPESSLSR